jgi:alkanesulfonate monooxygenase SsuD/methylene tetrahydromethanopterin reductase-like flavin-dependent oxidoreductase (luciferase family)
MKAQIGLVLPSREVLLWGGGKLTTLVEKARVAERLGYDSVWVGDSLLARPRGEPLLLLAAMSSITSRIRLGTAVLLPLLRHPVSLAHMLATLDRLSQGRIIVGVGPGAELPGTHAELAALGVPSERRVTALLDAIDRCRRIWRGEEPGVDLPPGPQTPGGPPIWLAAQGPRMLRETGRRFDGWLPFSPTAADFAAGLEVVREAAASAGRDPESIAPGVYLTLAIADQDAEAARDFDAYIRAYYGVPGEVMARLQASHSGTIESAIGWIEGYIRAGAQHVLIRLARTTLDGYDETAGRLLAALHALHKAPPTTSSAR